MERFLRRLIVVSSLAASWGLAAFAQASVADAPRATTVVSTIGIPANATKLGVVPVELTPYGFVPEQITRTPGTFFIFVHNSSGPVTRNLSLSSLVGTLATVLKQPLLNVTSPHWTSIVTLLPGNYTITETNHPTWKCTLTIQ